MTNSGFTELNTTVSSLSLLQIFSQSNRLLALASYLVYRYESYIDLLI